MKVVQIGEIFVNPLNVAFVRNDAVSIMPDLGNEENQVAVYFTGIPTPIRVKGISAEQVAELLTNGLKA